MTDKRNLTSKHFFLAHKSADACKAAIDEIGGDLSVAFGESAITRPIFAALAAIFAERSIPTLDAITATGENATKWAVWNDLDEHARIVMNDERCVIAAYSNSSVFDEFPRNIMLVGIRQPDGKGYAAIGIYEFRDDSLLQVGYQLDGVFEDYGAQKGHSESSRRDAIDEFLHAFSAQPDWISTLFASPRPSYLYKPNGENSAALVLNPLVQNIFEHDGKALGKKWEAVGDTRIRWLAHSHTPAVFPSMRDAEMLSHYVFDMGPNLAKAVSLGMFGENMDDDGDDDFDHDEPGVSSAP
jgi:hypothetical protein